MKENSINWEKIWSFIKSKLFVAAIIISLISLSAYQCSRIQELKRRQQISDQNQIALNDSIRYEKLKNGEFQASITSYIASEKELKELNKSLYDKIKQQSGDIFSLNNAIIQLRLDSAMLSKYLVEKDKVIQRLLKLDENTYAAPWSLSYRYDSLNYDVFTGRTYIQIGNKDPLELLHADTELISRLTQIDLTWGQKIEKDKLRIFIQSSYPGFTVAQMQGVLIDPNNNPYIKSLLKKKHWLTGFSLGIGATGGFNITTGKYGLVVGPSILWNIYTF
jgi:hypothetical protein